MKPPSHPLTAAQFAVVREAAARPSRVLEPPLPKIKGPAWQSVVDALLAHGYATKCYFPTHVEYILTEAGLVVGRDDAAAPA